MAALDTIRDFTRRWLDEARLRLAGPPQYKFRLADFGIEWIFIELTGHCNMHCRFCPSDTLQRPKRFMKFETFKRVIDELAELRPTNPISFHVLGEPLLHPRFFDCLDYCAGRGLKVYLFSNGLITERKIAELCRRDNIEALVLSVQTPTAESFALRGVQKSFEDYWQSILGVIRHVVATGANRKMRVELHNSNTRLLPFKDWDAFGGNESVLGAFRSMARDIKRLYVESRGKARGEAFIERWLDRDFRKIPQNLWELREWNYWGYPVVPNVYLRMKDFGTFAANEAILPPGVTIRERQERAQCPIASNTLCVLADGAITLCCVDSEGETRIGHMKHRGIYKALHSERRASLRENVTQLGVCRRCLGALENAECRSQETGVRSQESGVSSQ